MLVSQTPGGLHERFYEELGEEVWDPAVPPATQNPPDFKKIAAIAVRYGIEIPPLVER